MTVKPAIYLTNAATVVQVRQGRARPESVGCVGPNSPYTIMAAPHPERGEAGRGTVWTLVPDEGDMRAAKEGEMELPEYRRRYENGEAIAPGGPSAGRESLPRWWSDNLDPGKLSACDPQTGRVFLVEPGATLMCACSREKAAEGRCHRVWAAKMLADHGWRVCLDGRWLDSGTPITESLILVLDTETTGPDPAEDRIVELGGAYFWRGEPWGAPMRVLCNPGIPIPAEASAVHGLHDADVAGAPTFADVAPRLGARVRGDDVPPGTSGQPVICGYNGGHFDGPLINRELDRAGEAWRIALTEMLDPLVWLRWYMRGAPSLKLGDVCAHFGVSLDNAHTAAADSVASGALLMALVRQGMIPDDVQAALQQQAEIAAMLDVERGRWSYLLYRERVEGRIEFGDRLLIGFGKHKGQALSKVDPGYLRFMLGKWKGQSGVPEDAMWIFRAAVGDLT